MPEIVNSVKYQNMISELNRFSNSVLTLCEDLKGSSQRCVQVLGEQDVATPYIIERTDAVVKKYTEHAAEAQRIAKQLQAELERALEEEKRLRQNNDE